MQINNGNEPALLDKSGIRSLPFSDFSNHLMTKMQSKCLFDKIEADSRASGAEYLEGPFNPNHYSELGNLN